MTDAPHHGISVTETTSGPIAINTISTAIIGAVVTADDADAEKYPLNKPVLVTNVLDAQDGAGTSGTLRKVLDAIADQTNCNTVLVRVPEHEDEADQTAAVIGDVANGQYTGMKALLAATGQLGVTPRILGAPGLDTLDVATEMVGIAQKLKGYVYASAWGAQTKEEAAAYRDNFGQREIMVIWPEFTTAADDTLLATARALGLRAKIDQEIGWHKTLSNIPVNGVAGLSKDVSWDLQDPSTDAGYLYQHQVTTLIQHEGFRFWGNRGCSSEPKYSFESYTRTAQVLRETVANAHFPFIDKPLYPSLGKDIVEGLNAKFRQMVREGRLIGAEAHLPAELNSQEALGNGQFRVRYKYTPVPPLENLGFIQEITDEYLVDFAAQAAAA